MLAYLLPNFHLFNLPYQQVGFRGPPGIGSPGAPGMYACGCTSARLAFFEGLLTCSQALPVETVSMERLEGAVVEDRYACVLTTHLSSLQPPLLTGWLSWSTW